MNLKINHHATPENNVFLASNTNNSYQYRGDANQ